MNTRTNAKITLISLAIIMITLTACQTPSASAKEPVATQKSTTAKQLVKAEEPASLLASLPADLVIPSELPTTIQDPLLMEAWIRLYTHQDEIQLWDGNTITGRDLAQYLLDHAIPVMWDTNRECGTGSCSVRYCEAGTDICDFEDGEEGIDPIYINLAIQSKEDNRLIGTLAHEIFHRTAPFGNVADTLFEEFIAYTIGTQISQSSWPTFEGYDGMNPASLQRWFNENGLMGGYQGFALYPQGVNPTASETTQDTSSTSDDDFTCTTDQYGLVTCK